MLKTVKIITFLLFIAKVGYGQNSTPDRLLANIAPFATTSQDSLTDIYNGNADFRVYFKIQNISAASKVYLNVGSTDGGSQTLSLTYNVTSDGNGGYVLQRQNESIAVINGNVKLVFTDLLFVMDNFRFIEVWIEDSSQQLSTKLKRKL